MWEQIRYNQTRSAMLIAGMGVLLFLLSFVISIPLARMFNKNLFESGIGGIIFASIIWMGISLLAYFQGDDMLLSLSGARRISYGDHPRFYNIVEEMRIASGLEVMPSVYIVDDPAMNAFAIGCRPEKAAVIVTSGLLTKLNRDELQGVIGHEMAHIQNRDVLLISLCIMLLDTITLLAWLIMPRLFESRNFLLGRYYWLLPFVSFSIAAIFTALIMSSESVSGSGFLLVLIFYVLAFVLSMPIFAQLIYYATSRRREYLADASSALYTRYPEGLASALEKIAASTDQVLAASPVTAPIYIINPFRSNGLPASDITSTHPPVSERIRILRSMSHASYADYDRAYRQVRNIDTGIIPAAAVASAAVVPMRTAMPDELDHIQRARETSNVLWNLNKYKIVDCSCGTRMRVPPGFKLPEVRCPHCGRMNPV
jgi:heat shock protein HtpX